VDAAIFNDKVAKLVDEWCARRELGALAGLLPAWLSNNGLTDGWEELCSALRTTANYQQLPAHERDTLKKLWIDLDTVLRNR
jgi:hypothetical protein